MGKIAAKFTFLLVCLCFCSLNDVVLAKSLDTVLDIEGIYWEWTFEGDVALSREHKDESVADLVEDLGFEDKNSIGTGKISCRLGERSALSFSYLSITHKGEKRAERSFIYKGDVYPIGIDIISAAELMLWELRYEGAFIRSEKGELVGLAGIKYVDMSVTVDTEMWGHEEGSISIPLPVLGLSTQLRIIDGLSLGAEIVGVFIKTSDGMLSVFDAGAKLNWDIFKNVRISGGYRLTSAEAEINDASDHVKISYAGPFASVTISF